MRRSEKEPRGSFFHSATAGGFTLMELVAVLIIVSILAVVAIPRLTRGVFDDAKLYDESLAALRYAQRTAIAYQRTVCITFSGNSQLSLTYASAYGSSTCNTNVLAPGGNSPSYVVTAQGAATYSATPNFSFDRVGRPSAGQTIGFSSGKTITVEADTGYAH